MLPIMKKNRNPNNGLRPGLEIVNIRPNRNGIGNGASIKPFQENFIVLFIVFFD
jgi:hypothetical protein